MTTAFVDASFSVAFTGHPLPAVSWQFSADGATWNDVPGATTSSLVVRSPVVAHNGTRWRARLAGPGMDPLFSNPATLTVTRAAASITVTGRSQRFDGTAHAVTVTTVPAGLRVSVRYLRDDEPVAAPVDVGTYTVIVEASGSNHAGSTTVTMSVTE